MQNIKKYGLKFEDKKRKKKQPFYWEVFFLCLFVFILGYCFHDNGGFSDVGRYYEMIDIFFSGKESIIYVIGYMYAYGNDFIYYLSLFLSAKTPLGMQFVTGVVSATYYYLLMHNFMRMKPELNSKNLVLLLGLFCIPNVIYIITISRTAMALVFIFIGILLYTKKHRLWALIFFVFAVLSHFGSLMFVAVFFITLLLYNIRLDRSLRTVNLLCTLLPPIMLFLGLTIFNTILETGVFSFLVDTRYDVYVANTKTGSQYANFSWIYHLQFIFSMIFIYILLNVDKRNSFNRVLLLIYLSVTAAFVSASQNLFNRWLMVLPLIYSLYFPDLYNLCFSNKGKMDSLFGKRTLIIGSFISIMIFIFLVYGTRTYIF